VRATLLAVAFAEISLLGGLVLSLAPGLPVSGYVSALSFLLYVGCRVVGRMKGSRVAAA
jgi:zinc/manganese transport system permease protein